jgi:multidrug transporter EmrE-like cation transporter
MTLGNVLLILTCVLGISAGQIFFKLASASIPAALDMSEWLQFAVNKYFVVALVIYGAATIGWILALKRVDLYIAYPFMALAFIVVPCASYYFLGEPLTGRTFIGASLIVAGLIISVT